MAICSSVCLVTPINLCSFVCVSLLPPTTQLVLFLISSSLRLIIPFIPPLLLIPPFPLYDMEPGSVSHISVYPHWWLEMLCNPLVYSFCFLIPFVVGIQLPLFGLTQSVFKSGFHLIEYGTLMPVWVHGWSETFSPLLLSKSWHRNLLHGLLFLRIAQFSSLRGSRECSNPVSPMQILHLSEPLQSKNITPSFSWGCFDVCEMPWKKAYQCVGICSH